MENRDKFKAETLRDFSIFFAVLLFTGIVGIIELLSEFDKINGIFGLISISGIYFGLLGVIIFSIDKFFMLYKQNRGLKVGFNFYEIEILIYHIGEKILKIFMITIVSLFFTLLYLVKIGLLK